MKKNTTLGESRLSFAATSVHMETAQYDVSSSATASFSGNQILTGRKTSTSSEKFDKFDKKQPRKQHDEFERKQRIPGTNRIRRSQFEIYEDMKETLKREKTTNNKILKEKNKQLKGLFCTFQLIDAFVHYYYSFQRKLLN